MQDAKNQAANGGKRRAGSFATAKVPIAGKGSFDQWRVTDMEDAEEEGWGMGAGQQQKLKRWAQPTRQKNDATATLNHRQSLVFKGTAHSLLWLGSSATLTQDFNAMILPLSPQ